jgi:hypothetical protein
MHLSKAFISPGDTSRSATLSLDPCSLVSKSSQAIVIASFQR